MPRKSNASAPGPLENMRVRKTPPPSGAHASSSFPREPANLCPRMRQQGTVHFYGKTKFAQGVWVGIELDAPLGNHSGTIKGETYFTCKEKHGVFVRPAQVEVLDNESDQENHLGIPPPPDANANVNASSPRTDRSPGSDSAGSETSALTQPNQLQVTSVDDATLLARHKAHVGQMLALLETEMVMIAEVEASQTFVSVVPPINLPLLYLRRHTHPQVCLRTNQTNHTRAGPLPHLQNQQHRRKLLGIKQNQATLVGDMLGLVGRWEPNSRPGSSEAGSTSTEGTA